ncbi:MAG: acyl-CoA thioesterase [Burkholderiales bacterium]
MTKGVTKAEGSTLEVGDTFESDMQMRWGEADSLNHMNNVVYFRYMEEGRIQSFAAAGIESTDRCGPVVVHVSCDFFKQINYPSTVRVTHRVVRIGRSSLEHEVDLAVVEGDATDLRARGRSIMVWMDFELAKSAPWPPEVLSAMARTANR